MFTRFWISVSFLLALLTSGCVSNVNTTVPPRSQSSLIKEMGSSTAALVMRRGDMVAVYCTAVWVGQKTLLTANHCVDGAIEEWSEEHEGEDTPDAKGFKMYYIVQDEVQGVSKEPSATHLATVVMYDKIHDLALLKVDGSVIPLHTFATIASSSPEVGEHVSVIGHVRGLYWSYIECVVSAYRKELPTKGLDIEGPFLQLSGPVYYGNSGGGAFNSKGELVGIASFMARAPQTSMFIPVESIKPFLKVK